MKLCILLILLSAGATLASIEKRIVGSVKCGTDRQYHVEIKTKQRKTPCGATLLNSLWVLTAAHCGEQDLEVTLGANYDSFFFRKKTQEIKTNQQFPYKDEEGKAHDIMLIKLNKLAPGELPTLELPSECTRPAIKTKVQVGGWGPDKEGEKTGLFSKLMCATTSVSACGEKDKPGSTYHSDETNTMCADTPGVKSCYGDSGSAVVYNNHLHGIIVSNPVDKCAFPIVMLDICHYKEWIEKTMEEHSKHK